MAYGKFESFEAFLDSYVVAQKKARDAAESAVVFSRRKNRRRRGTQRDRDVVEVTATIAELLPDDTQGSKHQHIKITLATIIKNDDDVEADVEERHSSGEAVFVSVRYGDRMGLVDRVPNLHEGDELHLRGEWIPKDKAYAHGGEKMSVLHFTHDPLGFICTTTECYS